MIETSPLTLVVIGLAAILGLLLGGLIGASVAMAQMADQVAECHRLRAESAELNAESIETAVAVHGSIIEWACTMRGGLCR